VYVVAENPGQMGKYTVLGLTGVTS